MRKSVLFSPANTIIIIIAIASLLNIHTCYGQMICNVTDPSAICKECKGKGFRECDKTRTCIGCKGTGFYSFYSFYSWTTRPCATCGGTGQMRCIFCYGTGRLSCACKGTGHRQITKADLPEGVEVCRSCYGKGYLYDNSTCITCAGTGVDILGSSTRSSSQSSGSSYGNSSSNSSSSGSSYRGKLTPEQYRSNYSNWESQAHSCYEQLVREVNAGGQNYQVKRNTGSGSTTYNYETKRNLIRIQGEMRNLRQEAARYGVNISQSYYETVSVR